MVQRFHVRPKHRVGSRRLSRDEKARRTREAILSAGCRVVAAEGYAAAAVARVAEEAGVAQGTFYNYFGDRQGLFDQLLPYEGLRMRAWVEDVARAAPPGMGREIARFEAFLDYVSENKGFYRTLYEAEIFAPKAHHAHFENIVEGYTRSLKRAMAAGWIRELDDFRLRCLIHQILGIRAYAAMQIHYAADEAERERIKAASVETYEMLINQGLRPPGTPE